METTSAIRFDREDLITFAEASHDRNPLHLSESYARRTPYGEPVVFGILGAIAALGHLPPRPGRELASLALVFRQPLYTGVDYVLETTRSTPEVARLTVRDAGRVMLTATFRFREGTREEGSAGATGTAPRPSAATLDVESVAIGASVSGAYAVAPGPFRKLFDRWGLAGKGAAPGQIGAMLWTSYLVGMELPGERALFSGCKIDFADGESTAGGPFSFRARVAGFDTRFDLLELSGRLERGGRSFATAEVSSYVRRDVPRLSRELLSAAPGPDALPVKSALVTGGSRGLGAALVGALALQGCDVVLAYRSSTAEAERLRADFGDAPGSIVPVQADASDPVGCARLRREVLDRFEGLDCLICNANPPLHAIGFTPDSIPRYRAYLDECLALSSLPLATFLDLLEQRGAWNILISSAVGSPQVADIPPDWHHYVAAKYAAEGLVRSVASQYDKGRHLIVRPPRFLSDMTNTPAGREGAHRVEGIAASVVRRLCRPRPEQRVEVMDEFPCA